MLLVEWEDNVLFCNGAVDHWTCGTFNTGTNDIRKIASFNHSRSNGRLVLINGTPTVLGGRHGEGSKMAIVIKFSDLQNNLFF